MATTYATHKDASFTAFYGGTKRGRCLQISRGHEYEELTAADVRALQSSLGRKGNPATVLFKGREISLSRLEADAWRAALRTWIARSYT